MPRTPKVIDFEAETVRMLELIKAMVGKPVPLSTQYTRGERATLVAVDGDTATIRFRNGATLANVPIRDLVDDAAYWK